MRSILITGAGSGIGAGLATVLAADGHHLLVSDADLAAAEQTTQQVRAAGGSAEALALDVTDERSIAQALAAASRAPEVLINNAGLQHVAPLEEFPMQRWALLVDVMLTGAARLSRAVLPGMRAGGYGRIVNIGSIHSLVASPYKSAYVAAKHGLIGLSRCSRWKPPTATSPPTRCAPATCARHWWSGRSPTRHARVALPKTR